MREILFRGKRESDGRWLYGLYSDDRVHGTDFPCIMPLTTEEDDGDWAVLERTVSQYTGLTDKNGTKIFEGDILEFTDSDGVKSPYIIEWEEVDCCYVIERPDGEWFEILEPEQYRHNCVCDDYISDDCVNWRCDRFEIISNIHDNPDFFDGTSYDKI